LSCGVHTVCLSATLHSRAVRSQCAACRAAQTHAFEREREKTRECQASVRAEDACVRHAIGFAAGRASPAEPRAAARMPNCARCAVPDGSAGLMTLILAARKPLQVACCITSSSRVASRGLGISQHAATNPLCAHRLTQPSSQALPSPGPRAPLQPAQPAAGASPPRPHAQPCRPGCGAPRPVGTPPAPRDATRQRARQPASIGLQLSSHTAE
jgi:hypothetical protein